MINKKSCSIIAIMVVLSAVSLSQARELKNDFYFTIQPDSSKCFNIRLPSDMGVYEDDRVKIVVDSKAESNIKFIEVSASPSNQVSVPLCFSSENMKERNFANYSIKISSEKSGEEIVTGGFCVSSNKTDFATGRPETNPCDFIIKDEKLFDIFFQYGDRMPVKKDTTAKIPVRAYSQNKLDLELAVKSGLDMEPKNQLLKLEPRKWETFYFEIPPAKAGNYPIELTAHAVIDGKLCDSEILPFCKKTISTTAMIDSLGLQGWHLYVTPSSYSAFNTLPIPYSAVIENYGEDAEFSLELKLPKGLISEFEKEKVVIPSGGKKEFLINITPQIISAENFEIGFVAKGDIEKTARSYLSFRDTEENINSYWSEIRDSLTPETRIAIDAKIRDFVTKYREKGIDAKEYEELLSLLEKAKGEIFVGDIKKIAETGNRPTIKSTDPFNPLIPIISVIAAVFLVSAVFYIRNRNKNQEEEEF